MVIMKWVYLIGVLFLGCNATSYLVPLAEENEGISVHQMDQRQVTVSVREGSVAALHGTNETRSFTLFLYLKNESQEEILFTPDSVKLYGIRGNQKVQLHTYNHYEYVNGIRTKQKLSDALEEMEKTIEDPNPENMTIIVNEDVTEANGLVDTNTNSENMDKEERIQARQDIEKRESKEMREERIYRESILLRLLKQTVMYPGDQIFGDIMMRTSAYDKYLLSIPVGKDVHEIYFTLEKNEPSKKED